MSKFAAILAVQISELSYRSERITKLGTVERFLGI